MELNDKRYYLYYMNAIKIYCLVNSLDSKPFYVGATKNELKTRLGQHTHGLCNSLKDDHIRGIVRNGGKIQIVELISCNIYSAGYYEHFFAVYMELIGFNLLQSAFLFNYSQQQIKRNNNRNTKRLPYRNCNVTDNSTRNTK